MADFNEALAVGGPTTRLLVSRSRLQVQRNKADLAWEDHVQALCLIPGDEESYNLRGCLRAPTDPDGALDDFGSVLQLNRASLLAWQNMAAVQSRRQPTARSAVHCLTKLLEFHPEYAYAWASRAVLLAREGRDSEAIADVKESLKLGEELPALHYLAANTYSLCSHRDAAYRHDGLRYLWKAIHQGYGLDLVEEDGDFKALRGLPEFRNAVEAARLLRK